MRAYEMMDHTFSRREFAYGLVAASSYAAVAPLLRAEVHPASKPLLQLQQEFLDLRFGMFIHLNMATYEQREWGDPRVSPMLFNPAHLDSDQWAAAATAAGMAYGFLTTKHHDGFCLWPTATSSVSVKDAAYKRDIVRSYVDSFRREGLKTCLYFSVLDLRTSIRPYCITPDKKALVKAQLTELLTQYGEIPAILFDGWNADWSRITYEQLPFREIYDHIKSLQPNCLVFDHNAGTYPGSVLYYGDLKQYEQHAGQTISIDNLVPSQSGPTLQSEWFWKESFPTEKLASVSQIVDEWLIPFNKRHCNLILNVAPNRDGRFDQNAVERLADVGKYWKDREAAPKLASSIAVTTPNLAYAQPSYASSYPNAVGPDLANDNRFDTFWIAERGETSGWVEIAFDKPTAFNTVAIVEPRGIAAYGSASRISAYQLQCWDQGAWRTILSGGEPSASQFHRFDRVTTRRVRIVVKSSTKAPGLAEFGVYNEPTT